MATFAIDLDRYFSDMRALAPNVSKVSTGGYRVVKGDSTAQHLINLKDGTDTLTLYLNEANFYVLGFKNSANTVFRFSDHEITGQASAVNLGISGAYVGTNSLGLYESVGKSDLQKFRKRKQISEAVTTLRGWVGGKGSKAEDIAIHLATMIFLISESLRFTKIFGHMVAAVKDEAHFTFAEFQDYVQSWNKISTGSGPPAGTTLADVFIRTQ